MIILRTHNRFDDTKNTGSGEPIRRLNFSEVMTLERFGHESIEQNDARQNLHQRLD